MFIKAHLANLMNMAVTQTDMFEVTLGFKVALSYLNSLTKRAMELKDTELLAYLNQLGFIKADTEEEEEFNRILTAKCEKKEE